jgi:hypothetical protein
MSGRPTNANAAAPSAFPIFSDIPLLPLASLKGAPGGSCGASTTGSSREAISSQENDLTRGRLRLLR